jgi:transcriptional regulator with PAS, ATPase and Fis domain
LRALAEVAPSTLPVLVRGETGTGKELAARAVHARSGRAGPFVAVNCGALPATLVESELFGARRGAYSGAVEERVGLVRAAEGGTLFLDEIGDLAAPSQAALLRVLEEREVLPLGAARPLRVDVRFVAATHRDLDALAQAGTFRADLLARLAGFTLALPPLRARREDLGLLARALLAREAPERAARATFSVEAARALFRHRWPANVRELGKCLHAAALLARDGAIGLAELPEALRVAPDEAPLSDEDARRRAELAALVERHGGNVSAIARALGKDRKQVQRWLKRFKIEK